MNARTPIAVAPFIAGPKHGQMVCLYDPEQQLPQEWTCEPTPAPDSVPVTYRLRSITTPEGGTLVWYARAHLEADAAYLELMEYACRP